MTRKIALGVFLLAIIFFLMPWVNVSCMGQEMASTSGMDMVRGVYSAPAGYTSDEPQSEALAIWALAAAGVGLVFSFFEGGIALVIRILAGLAGIGVMVALKYKLTNDFNNSLGGADVDTGGVVQLNFIYGYWLTMAAFALGAIVSAFNKKISVKITDSRPPA